VEELTNREVTVLKEFAHGFTYVEVGQHLNISHETVKAHMRNIRFKLGARNTTHAVAIACRERIFYGDYL
jgi:two-component system, NarL family, response regulator